MNVKQLREEKNLSQQELAAKTGIPKDRIAKWEQGKGSPKSRDSEILLKFFGEKVPHGTNSPEVKEVVQNASTSQLIEAIIILTRNNEKVIDTNATVAETNRVLANKLVSIQNPTDDDGEQTLKETVYTVLGHREYIIDLASQLINKPKKKIEEDLDNKVKQAKDKLENKHSFSEDKQHSSHSRTM